MLSEAFGGDTFEISPTVFRGGAVRGATPSEGLLIYSTTSQEKGARLSKNIYSLSVFQWQLLYGKKAKSAMVGHAIGLLLAEVAGFFKVVSLKHHSRKRPYLLITSRQRRLNDG